MLSISGYSQGIGVNNPVPDPSALLDLTDPVRGLLVPRVALSSRLLAAPIVAPATSLMVYNTATAGVFPNNVTPGYYIGTEHHGTVSGIQEQTIVGQHLGMQEQWLRPIF